MIGQHMDEAKSKPRDDCLPLSKIRTIMKSSPDIELVSQESLPIVCRATEMFIQHFITQAYVHSKDKKCIGYGDIAVAVENEENLHFLSDILPRKRLAGECIDMSKKKSSSPTKSDPEPQR
ncbi:chromatin accessibility complex protein 1-like [Amphibalanus amphitrite]|uniref:chromatin accessibility complex protein 1-like n=1 Tax=Amphibalanus amphitrite TaxID=1232801 RepID=UPI001C915633|nr:chromatin accessibility complex protein 1-like [Amphibalanus amphitrite]